MKLKRYQFAFVVFFLLFQAKWSSAVVPDANILGQIRKMKNDRLASLDEEKAKLALQIRQCRYAEISDEKTDPYNRKSAQSEKRQTGRNHVKMTFKSQKEKIEKLEQLQGKLRSVNQKISAVEVNDLSIIIPVFGTKYEIGDFGRFGEVILGSYKDMNYVHHQSLKIISIINDKNALVDFTVTERFQDSPAPRESGRLIGYRTGHYVPVTETIWLRGVDVSDKITGSYYKSSGFFIITGTQDYENLVGGKQTVYVFEPLEIDPNVL